MIIRVMSVLSLAFGLAMPWYALVTPSGSPPGHGGEGGSDFTTRVSVGSYGLEANSYSYGASMSDDGRAIAFHSAATNLVEGDTNSFTDVFVHDRGTRLTTRVSVSSEGTAGNGLSEYPSISADGRYVAFHSRASNLVTNDSNNKSDVFVHDCVTHQTERVSVNSLGLESDGQSEYPSISADGRYVAFHSDAANLVTGDNNYFTDVFVHDRQTHQTFRVSVSSSGAQAHGASRFAAIAGRSTVVAFRSDAFDLVASDTNAKSDIFVHDWSTGVTSRESMDELGHQGDGQSFAPSISSDGRFVAFHSEAQNLIPEDGNFHRDVFVRDRVLLRTIVASATPYRILGNGDSEAPSLSANGRFVAFESDANNLVPGDTNLQRDILIYDLWSGEMVRASVDSAGVQSRGGSSFARMSPDGRYVSFQSGASNLVANDHNGAWDVFLHVHLIPYMYLPYIHRS